VPLPEVHNKTTKINGFPLQQPFLEQVGLCETIHSCPRSLGGVILASWLSWQFSFS